VSFSPNLDVTSEARTKRRSPTIHVIRDAQGTTCCPGKPLGRPLTAISPLTRSLEGATTLFRTRPLPCHHALSGNWAGSLISTRSHSRISSRTTVANASRLSAQIAKRWEPGLASNGVMVTIGFTRPAFGDAWRLRVIESRREAFGDGFLSAAALWIILGKRGRRKSGLSFQSPETMGSTYAKRACENQERVAYCFRSQRRVSASQTQSLNRRFRSGKSGSSLTKKFKRSQSSSPGHLPFHACRRASFGSKCEQPSACQPQCGQRSMSQPSRWRSPMATPQSGHGPSFLLMNTLARTLRLTLFSPEFLEPRRRPLGIPHRVLDILVTLGKFAAPWCRALDWRARSRRHDAACEGVLSMTAPPSSPARSCGRSRQS
jgi:hypothetical protein